MITCAMASLFFSIIIMCPFPRSPISASFTKSTLTPACFRYYTVQWLYGA
jgi:hypothetical protein